MKKIVITLVMLSLLAGWQPLKVSAQEPTQCEVEYTVQAGDWLSKIAEKYYGNPLAFDQIVETANASSSDAYADIANPNLLEPGWVLCLPPADTPIQPSNSTNKL